MAGTGIADSGDRTGGACFFQGCVRQGEVRRANEAQRGNDGGLLTDGH